MLEHGSSNHHYSHNSSSDKTLQGTAMLTQSPPRNIKELVSFLWDNPQVEILSPDGKRNYAEYRGFESGRIWFRVGEQSIHLSLLSEDYPGYGMPAEPAFEFSKKAFTFNKAGVELKVIYA
jgi:hypothetical protein